MVYNHHAESCKMNQSQSYRGLIFSGAKGDTRRYRTLHLWEQFTLLGVDAHLSHLMEEKIARKIEEEWDFVVLHRVPCDRYVEQLLSKARSKGALILFDVDDLIFDPSVFQFIKSPDFTDSLRSSMYKEMMRQVKATLDLSDAVLASTSYLAGVVKSMGKPVWVHRNAFSLEMLKQSQAALENRKIDASRVVVGYASGTPTHNHDFALIKPALKQVLSTYSHVDLQVIGLLDIGEDWGELSQRVTRLPLVPWRKLPSLLARLDINLAPLVTGNPFAQSKSEIKYMEAAMVGVPTIASPTDAFQDAIQNGENGFLAETTNDWNETLGRLVESPSLRRSVGESAYEHTMRRYHPAARALDLASTIDEISDFFHRPQIHSVTEEELRHQLEKRQQQAGWIAPEVEKDPSYFQQGLYTFKRRGFKELVKQVWIYFRRAVSPVFPF